MNLPHLDWPSILVTAAFASLGAVAGMAIKQWLDRSLEERKVHWVRASWVHQRQVEALTKLFVALHQMKDLLQGATRSVRFQGEMSQEDYFKEWQLSAAKTWSEFIEQKLLLNQAIVARIEELFRKFQEAGVAIGSAAILREGEARMEAAAEWKRAAEIAHKLIPPLLDAIELEARRVVHDESRS
jgi:hypothetical protein